MRPLLEPLVVKDKTLDNHLLENRCRPDAELRGLITVHAVAYGDNGVEVVNVGIVHLSIGGSYPNFSEN